MAPVREAPGSARGLARTHGTVMSDRDTALVHSLDALYRDAPSGSLVELRFRTGGGMGRRFHRADRLDIVAVSIERLAPQTDVYVGVLPRRRRSGGRADLVARGATLWADCDTSEAAALLVGFAPPPSLVVASGTDDHRHAYWLLREPVDVNEIERTNRHLATVLGADLACAEPARILRPPSLNHKHEPPALVELERCDRSARHDIDDVLAAFGDVTHDVASKCGPLQRSHEWDGDPLRALAPAIYVEALAGLSVPRHRKVRCPFHEDGTPSLHVYPEPERGWYCFGCGRGGSVYDFAALLWDRTPRGADFVELRRELLTRLPV